MSESIGDLQTAALYATEAIEAGLVSRMAVKLSLTVSDLDDFDTEVFKSDCAFTSVPEIGLEVCKLRISV